jgi:hypothetical protein
LSFIKHLLPAWKTNLQDKSKANAAILDAIDKELTDGETDAIEGRIVMSLNSSTGEWLNQYGKAFGVLRKDDELDETYRDRVIEYVLLERGTLPAIKEAIQSVLQDYSSYISIYEPYTNVFTFGKSKLSGEDRMLGNYYRGAVIDVTFTNYFPIGILRTINDFRPAGVMVKITWDPKSYNPSAPIFTKGHSGDLIQEAQAIQANRDSVYLSIENSGIIGYKRIHKVCLARPLDTSTEDVGNPPHPLIMYGEQPWVLVPRSQAKTEGAKWVYLSVKLEGKDFEKKAYNNVGVHLDVIPAETTEDTLTPSEVQSSGTQIVSESRGTQERADNVTIFEQFMIEITSG